MPNTLYVSPKCQHCRKLEQQLQENPSANSHFQIVNVHFATQLDPRVRSVPTIVTEKNEVSSGAKAFDYVKQLLSNNEYGTMESFAYNPTVYSFIDGETSYPTQWTSIGDQAPKGGKSQNSALQASMDPRLAAMLAERDKLFQG